MPSQRARAFGTQTPALLNIAICTQLNQKAGWDGKKSCDQPKKLAQSTNCTDKNLARKLVFVTESSRRSWENGSSLMWVRGLGCRDGKAICPGMSPFSFNAASINSKERD